MCLNCLQFGDEARFVQDYVIYATECQLKKHKVISKQKDGYKFYECHNCGVVYHEAGVDILWGVNTKEMEELTQ